MQGIIIFGFCFDIIIFTTYICRHSKYFTCIYLILTANLCGMYHNYHHFIDEETEAKKLGQLPEVLQVLNSDENRIQTQVHLTPKLFPKV